MDLTQDTPLIIDLADLAKPQAGRVKYQTLVIASCQLVACVGHLLQIHQDFAVVIW